MWPLCSKRTVGYFCLVAVSVWTESLSSCSEVGGVGVRAGGQINKPWPLSLLWMEANPIYILPGEKWREEGGERKRERQHRDWQRGGEKARGCLPTYLQISIDHVPFSMQVVQRRHYFCTVEPCPLFWEHAVPWQMEEKLRRNKGDWKGQMRWKRDLVGLEKKKELCHCYELKKAFRFMETYKCRFRNG